jgi:hypothetical protein
MGFRGFEVKPSPQGAGSFLGATASFSAETTLTILLLDM